MYLPMLTSLIPSSWIASRAIVMFSRAWGWDCGLLLCLSFRFCNVSTSATNLERGVVIRWGRIVSVSVLTTLSS